MTRLALLRHAPTAWNAAGRIQGRCDEPLSAEGRAMAATWLVPREVDGWNWVASPLTRARETAALLGHDDAAVEAGLVEMEWGAWGGHTLAALRARHGAAMAANEAAGLDFRPQDGESPREVCARLGAWFDEVAAAGRPTVAVSHRGVQRAALSLATGWDYRTRPPLKLPRAAFLMLDLAVGTVRLAQPAVVSLEGP